MVRARDVRGDPSTSLGDGKTRTMGDTMGDIINIIYNIYPCIISIIILGNGKMAHDFWKLRWHKRQKSKKNKMATEYHGRTRCAIYLFHKWGVKWPKTKRQDPVDILLQECAILGVSIPCAANSSFFVPLLLKIQKIQKI